MLEVSHNEKGEGNDKEVESVLAKQKEIKNRLLQEQNYWYDLALNPNLVPEFDPDDLFEFSNDDGLWNVAVSVFGQRRTGKTTLVKELLTLQQQQGRIGRIGIITDTKDSEQWNIYIPDATIYPIDMANEVIEQILKFQTKLMKDYKAGKKIEPKDCIQYTLILDDFVHDTSFSKYSDSFAKVYGTGRWHNMAVILLSQQPQRVSTFVRSNSDFVIVFKTQGKRENEYVANDHLFFMDKNAAYVLTKNITLNFKALIINKTPNILDQERLWWFLASMYVESEVKVPLGNPEWRNIIESIPTRKEILTDELRESIRAVGKTNMRQQNKLREFIETAHLAYEIK